MESRFLQNSNDPAGTENDVAAICPAPSFQPERLGPCTGRSSKSSRRTAFVAVIEVVDVVIVEVDGLLHQSKTQRLHTQIQIVLCVVDRRCDVVETENGMFHVRSVRLQPGLLVYR